MNPEVVTRSLGDVFGEFQEMTKEEFRRKLENTISDEEQATNMHINSIEFLRIT